MKSCPNCGNQLNTNETICERCGNPVKEEITKGTQISEHPKRFSKKSWLWLISLIFIFAITITAFSMLSYHFGSAHTAETLSQAIKNNDATVIAQLVKSTDTSLKITKQTVKPFIDYIKEHPKEKKAIIEEVKKQGDGEVVPYPLFQIREEENKQWGLFKKYSYIVAPFYLKLDTKREGAMITINGGRGEKEKDRYSKFGPLFPGKYTVKGTWKGEFTTLTDQKTVSLVGDEHQQFVDLGLEGFTVNLNSNHTEAEVFVNGNDTGKKVSDLRNIGPITPGTKIQLKLTGLPWGDAQSEPVTITKGKEDYYISLVPFDEKVMTVLMNTVNDFAKQRALANSTRDPGKYQNVGESYMVDLDTGIRYDHDADGWSGAKLIETDYLTDQFDYRMDYKNRYAAEFPAKFIFKVPSKMIVQEVHLRLVYLPDTKGWQISYCNEYDVPIKIDPNHIKKFTF